MTASVERVSGKEGPGDWGRREGRGERPSSFSLREIKSKTAGVEKQLYEHHQNLDSSLSDGWKNLKRILKDDVLPLWPAYPGWTR